MGKFACDIKAKHFWELSTPSNFLPLHPKQIFPPIIWIFIEGEGDGMDTVGQKWPKNVGRHLWVFSKAFGLQWNHISYNVHSSWFQNEFNAKSFISTCFIILTYHIYHFVCTTPFFHSSCKSFLFKFLSPGQIKNEILIAYEKSFVLTFTKDPWAKLGLLID